MRYRWKMRHKAKTRPHDAHQRPTFCRWRFMSQLCVSFSSVFCLHHHLRDISALQLLLPPTPEHVPLSFCVFKNLDYSCFKGFLWDKVRYPYLSVCSTTEISDCKHMLCSLVRGNATDLVKFLLLKYQSQRILPPLQMDVLSESLSFVLPFSLD